MACNKVCFVDQVCRFDRFLTETKVRHCNTAGLLGVIIEVSLSVHICVVTDDLDGVLVSTYSTVCSKSPELTVDGSFRSCNKRSACLKRKVCNIIYDTDGEFLFVCILIYSNDLCRCSILGTKSVTSCEDRCTRRICCPLSAATTSRYRGSPRAPGSFVLSRTEICFTVSGIASIRACAQNGLYRRTLTTPTFLPAATGNRWSPRWYRLQNP